MSRFSQDEVIELKDLGEIDLSPGLSGAPPSKASLVFIDHTMIEQIAYDDFGILTPLHVHNIEWGIMCAFGRIRLWKDGIYWIDLNANEHIKVQPMERIIIMSVQAPTIIYAIHDVSRGPYMQNNLREYGSLEARKYQ